MRRGARARSPSILATRVVVAGSLTAVARATPAAAAPAPCGGIPQIADAVGDGHHENTDVTAAWLSEQAGRLQAVIQPRIAVWEPAHDDSDAAGFALIYDAGGQTRYVRAEAPRGAPVRFDHGTWSAAAGFASAGPTTGEAVAGPGGSVTIDVPGLPPGTLLARLFVLTYDGGSGADPHWVDRAPGGVEPGRHGVRRRLRAGLAARGAGRAAPRRRRRHDGGRLDAPRRLVGGGRTAVGGRVAPARAGVAVAGDRARPPRAYVRTAVTQADGSFSLLLPIGRRRGPRRRRGRSPPRRARSPSVSTVRIRVRRRAGGAAVVRGRVRPRTCRAGVLLLRRDAVRPAATARARDGRFRIRLADSAPRPLPGRLHPARRRAPSGPPRTPESSDEAHPLAGALAVARRARGPRDRRRPSVGLHEPPPSVDDPTGRRSAPQTRYVVANHGFTYVLRETNGSTATAASSTTRRSRARTAARSRTGTGSRNGADRRPGPRHVPGRPRSRARRRSRRGRATTRSTPTCRSRRGRAGLEDDPATWIPVVKASPASTSRPWPDPRGGLRGAARAATLRPADATQSTQRGVQLRPDRAHDRRRSRRRSRPEDRRDGSARDGALQGLLDAARAEIARLTAAAAPMTRRAAERVGAAHAIADATARPRRAHRPGRRGREGLELDGLASAARASSS